ncbi:MAG: transporter substrate-binding domain-containing protein [Rickettsiaceae bacterium]|nr:MAG: transporter substrate-binding domain-containing protein [Rickettsiaceae bacterium]
MQVLKNLTLIIVSLLIHSMIFAADKSLLPTVTFEHEINMQQCLSDTDKNILNGGWYLSYPYQFNKLSNRGYKLTGLDIELIKAIVARAGVAIKYDQVSWYQHQLDLRSGAKDIAAGATFTEQRAKFAYFSIPYRFEENALFILKDSENNLQFKNIAELLVQIRLRNFRLGTINGSIYSDERINEFINDQENKDIIFKYEDDLSSLQALVNKEIDGFIADKIVGAAAVLEQFASDKITEIELGIKTPIHLIFSKKTVPINLVANFNQEIKIFLQSNEYKQIIKAYLYPVLLTKTIDSKWFYGIGVMGTIAFAMSGVIIAYRENATLFGTFLLAMLPSITGGVMRDVMINRDAVSIILNPSYMYYILIIVLTGFFAMRLLDYYNEGANEDNLIKKIENNLLICCDALGQAAFIVTGVTVVVMVKIEPIILWGPFFAFLTSNGGGIIRDLLRKTPIITSFSGKINAEISIFWGLVFSIFLDTTIYNSSAQSIEYAVIVVIVGAVVTRLLIHYLKIPNIKLR